MEHIIPSFSLFSLKMRLKWNISPTLSAKYRVILVIIWDSVAKSQWQGTRFGTFYAGKFYILPIYIKYIRRKPE
jgi:hypothetical protein